MVRPYFDKDERASMGEKTKLWIMEVHLGSPGLDTFSYYICPAFSSHQCRIRGSIHGVAVGCASTRCFDWCPGFSCFSCPRGPARRRGVPTHYPRIFSIRHNRKPAPFSTRGERSNRVIIRLPASDNPTWRVPSNASLVLREPSAARDQA